MSVDGPYQIINVVTEAESQALMTLDEMKALLVGLTGPSSDQSLQMLIDQHSATIAKLVNRTFGYAKMTETFYKQDGNDRIYFSHWPVKYDDIEVLTIGGVDYLTEPHDWTIEEKSGTLFNPNGWSGTIDTVYSGGYHLPDEAPSDLKMAVSVITRDGYYTWQRGMLATGVRMLSHKGNRIQFHNPGQTDRGTSSLGGGSSATLNAVKSTLDHYFRHWI